MSALWCFQVDLHRLWSCSPLWLCVVVIFPRALCVSLCLINKDRWWWYLVLACGPWHGKSEGSWYPLGRIQSSSVPGVRQFFWMADLRLVPVFRGHETKASFCQLVTVWEISAEFCLAVKVCCCWSLLWKCCSKNKLKYGDAESRGTNENLCLTDWGDSYRRVVLTAARVRSRQESSAPGSTCIVRGEVRKLRLIDRHQTLL